SVAASVIAGESVACGGTLAGGANLVYGGTCEGLTAAGGDPRLGALRDNGGPTLTLAPAAGSAVIDGGGACATASDQRGRLRPAGAACDIGAVEFGPQRWTVCAGC